MSIAYQQLVAAWNATTSGSFTPISAGDFLGVFIADGQGATQTLTCTGTGAYTQFNPPGSLSDTAGGNTFGEFYNPSLTVGAQTISISDGTQSIGMGIEYSGVNSSVGSGLFAASGSATPSGSPVTVPTGSILVAACIANGVSGSVAVTGGGTSRSTGNLKYWSYAIGEWAGSGGAITPTFSNTLAAAYSVLQILLTPGGGTPSQKGGMFFADNFRPKIPAVAAAMFMPLSWSINRRNKRAAERLGRRK